MSLSTCVCVRLTHCVRKMEGMIFDFRLETSSLHVNILKLQRLSVFDDLGKKMCY